VTEREGRRKRERRGERGRERRRNGEREYGEVIEAVYRRETKFIQTLKSLEM